MYCVGKAACCRVAVAVGCLFALALMANPNMADKRQKPLLELGKQDGTAVELQLMVDKARTVACDREFIEVLVANPAIADVVTISNKQLYVLGKAAGITNISLVGPDKRVLGVVQVEVAHDLRDMTQRIRELDRKSTRLNSSHLGISYAVFCLKKKRNQETRLKQRRLINKSNLPSGHHVERHKHSNVRHNHKIALAQSSASNTNIPSNDATQSA